MSESILHLLPTKPDEVPSAPGEARAVAWLRQHFASVGSQRFETPVFVDAGQNFDSVSCSACGAALELGWWTTRMDEAETRLFSELSIHTPCCQMPTSLNDLNYDMPQGFARFTLSVRNPARPLKPAELRELEALLGTPLRVVWTRV